MKAEVAERFAAASAGATTDDVHIILQEFLAYVAMCPGCNDSGVATFGRGTTIDVSKIAGGDAGEGVPIPKGSEMPCPLCGGRDADGKPRGDANYVSWHCAEGSTEGDCRSYRKGDDRRLSKAHAKCGHRLMLPLDLFDVKRDL